VPKPGFKSYVLKEKTYNFWHDEFTRKKDKLNERGITSFTAFLTSIMSNSLERDDQSIESKLIFKKILLKDNKLVLKDSVRNRIAELTIQDGKIYCHLDEKYDCAHVGYAYSIPKVYDILYKKKANRLH